VSEHSSSFQKLSLRSNFSWTFVGNVVYAGCQWAMLVILVKLSTPENVGQFTLGLAVTTPIILFSNLQLRPIQATDVKRRFSFSNYLALRIITTIAAFFAIVSLIFIIGYEKNTAFVILLIGLAKSIESISDVYYGLLQQHERMDWIAISMILKGILSLLFLGVTVFLTRSIVFGSLALAIAWTIALIVYDIPKGQSVATRKPTEIHDSSKQVSKRIPQGKIGSWFQPEVLSKLALFALPLGFAMTLISLNSNIPRYFVERYLGQGKLGIFSAIAYLQIAGLTVITALGQSASPRLAQHYVEGQHRAFKQLMIKLLAIASVLGGLGILAAYFAGEEILTLLYRPEYSKDIDVFTWVMAASALSYVASILGYAATAKRRIYYQPVILCTSLIVSLLTCYLFIPNYGLLGASVSMVLTSAVTLFGYLLIVIKD
jgi:O-antigen/teichoic acid export membrane protein